MPLGTRLLDVNFLTHIYTGSDVTLNCVCQEIAVVELLTEIAKLQSD